MRLECVPIIDRNTQIPVTRSEMFYTIVTNQRQVRVDVYQGESIRPDENTLIGSLDLALSPAPEGSPIVIEYSYDVNGIIHVKVEQKGYSRKREVDLDSSKQDQKFLHLDLQYTEDKEVWDDFEDEDAQDDSKEVTNYILHKARNTLETIKNLAQRNTLQTLIAAYEQALLGEDEDTVDEAEENLVDYLDELDNPEG